VSALPQQPARSGRLASPRFYLVMGVSGSGKTVVGQALAARLGWDFHDADDLHPAANVAKMSAGIPLTDADRLPWLNATHELLISRLAAGRPGVLACSALKESYRRILLADTSGVTVVYLQGSYQLFRSRLATRAAHYMSPELLGSQFDDLEEPEHALVIDASRSVSDIVDEIAGRRAQTPKGG